MLALALGGAAIGLGLWIVFDLIGGPSTIAAATKKGIDAFQALSGDKDVIESYGKLMTPLGFLMAAPVALMGVALAFWRTVNQHRDSLLSARKSEAEIFAKGVEHLGHEKPSVRMGAALALESLARSSPRLLSQVIEILCAFVRDSRPVTPSETISVPDDGEETKKEMPPAPPSPPTDIQLTLDIIVRLRVLDRDQSIPIDLHGTDLSGAELIGADLSNAKLHGARLTGAKLFRANLSGAILSEANLSKVGLFRVNLSEAFLLRSILSETFLRNTNLSLAYLREANLSGADLSGANLSRANLFGANLSGADLSGAKLKGARNLNQAIGLPEHLRPKPMEE